MVDIVGKPRVGGVVTGCGQGATTHQQAPGAQEAESHPQKHEMVSDSRQLLRARRGMHLSMYGWMGCGVGAGETGGNDQQSREG